MGGAHRTMKSSFDRFPLKQICRSVLCFYLHPMLLFTWLGRKGYLSLKAWPCRLYPAHKAILFGLQEVLTQNVELANLLKSGDFKVIIQISGLQWKIRRSGKTCPHSHMATIGCWTDQLNRAPLDRPALSSSAQVHPTPSWSPFPEAEDQLPQILFCEAYFRQCLIFA